MERRSWFHRSAGSALIFVILLSCGAVAHAHAKLAGAEPAAQSTGPSPAKIQLHFSEEVAKKFSSFRLSDANGVAIPLSATDAADPKSLAATPKIPLAPGVYTVTWTAIASDDGHKSGGSFVFTVK